VSATAGIDFSTRAIDVVLLDDDTDHATWHRYPLDPPAFNAALQVRHTVLLRRSWLEDQGVHSVWIELPWARQRKAVAPLMRLQGAILSRLPLDLIAGELAPQTWKKLTVGKANASKDDVRAWAVLEPGWTLPGHWTQDAIDAYAIAYAGRQLERQTEAAA
jgi:Holliday junction resolvasome RuvABC endonuclease subunit